MDPNAALNSILCGHMIADHVDALRDWLRGDGFSPDPILLPVDCDPRFTLLSRTDDISATTQGLEQNGELMFSWREMERWDDFNDEYSPFDKVYETNATHAAVLAQAFISANDEAEFFAVLRFADAASGRSGGFFGAYIQGSHFTPYTDRSGDFTPSGYEQCRDLAYKFRDEATGQLWRLNLYA